MNRGAYIIYRIIGTGLTLLAYFAFFMDVAVTFQVGLQRAMLPGLFISACMVIYTVLSRLFIHVVVKDHRALRRSLKDWIIANAVVVILGLGFSIFQILAQVLNKARAEEWLGDLNKSMRDAYGDKAAPATQNMLIGIAVFFSVILSLGIIHAVWTLFLVNRNKEAFQ